MEVLEKIYTAADLDSLSDDGQRYELVRGRLIEMPPPKALYGKVASLLGHRLYSFVVERDLGEVYIHEIGYLLATEPDTVRGADLSFVSTALLAHAAEVLGPKYREQYFPFAPTLAVEIASPGNSLEELDDKIDDYLDAGAEMVWIVYPRRRHIEVYRPNAYTKLLTVEDTLTGEDVLPGFTLPVSEIFPND